MSGIGYRRDRAEREAARAVARDQQPTVAAETVLEPVDDTPTVTIPDEITGPTVIAGLSDVTYHAHRGSLSASGAKWLIPPDPCPAKFRYHQDHPQEKKAFDFGHVAHRLVLGQGAEFEVLDFDSMRTAAAKAADAEARAHGRVPILQAEYEKAVAVRDAVMADKTAGALFSDGQAELSLFWPDRETGIIRRARLDWLTNPAEGSRRFIGDLKTARSSQPTAFGKAAADYAYALSAANYVDGAIACGLDPDPAFLLTAVEKEEPFVVTTFHVDESILKLGRRLMWQALHLYAECTSTDSWPGFSTGVEPLRLPTYYTNRLEETLA